MRDTYNEDILRIKQDLYRQDTGFALLNDRDLDRLFTSALGSLFSHWRGVGSGMHRMKNPDHLANMDFTASLFPGMKYLHIIRDGRDVTVSGWFHNLRTERKQFHEAVPRSPEFAEDCARSWKAASKRQGSSAEGIRIVISNSAMKTCTGNRSPRWNGSFGSWGRCLPGEGGCLRPGRIVQETLQREGPGGGGSRLLFQKRRGRGLEEPL